MRGLNWLAVGAALLPLGACQTVGTPGARLPEGPLGRAEIQRCIETPHKVGANTVMPVPRPGYVFKPGYNFSVKEADGSYGFGYQQASDGHLMIRYPAQRKVENLEVTRRNGVVYFGADATSCP